jgi:hypothetical protein
MLTSVSPGVQHLFVVAAPKHGCHIAVVGRSHDWGHDVDRRAWLEETVAHVLGPEQLSACHDPTARSLRCVGPHVADFHADQRWRASRVVVARCIVRDYSRQDRL